MTHRMGELERRPRPRRHGHHPAAAGPAALRRASARMNCWRCSLVPSRRRRATSCGRHGRRASAAISRRDGMMPWRTASFRAPPARRQCAGCGRTRPPRAARRAASAADDPVPARSQSLRWPLRQQSVAAGTAAPADQADLGQSAADRAGSGASGWASRNGDRVRLSAGRRSLTVPVWIMPGQARGLRRWRCSALADASPARSAQDAGFDFYPLTRPRGPPSLRKGAGQWTLASTVHHDLLLRRQPRIRPAWHARRVRSRSALSRQRASAAASLSPEAARARPPGR